jgi:hypothetical protein
MLTDLDLLPMNYASPSLLYLLLARKDFPTLEMPFLHDFHDSLPLLVLGWQRHLIIVHV